MSGNIENYVVSVCHARLEAWLLVLNLMGISFTELLELACMALKVVVGSNAFYGVVPREGASERFAEANLTVSHRNT